MTLHSLKLPLSARARALRDASGGRSRAWRSLILGVVTLLVLGGLGAFTIHRMSQPTVIYRDPPPMAATSGGAAATGTEPGASVTSADKQAASRALEWLARNSLSQDRLMAPPADNAHYYFSRLLAIDPDNKAARQGFAAIAERFVVLAEEQFTRKNYDQAQAYITLGLQVDPDNKGLETLRSMIETHEKTFFETVADLFKSD